MGEVENALKNLTNEEFKNKYGREKPNSQSHVVFSCLKGRRSEEAMEIAKKLGIKKLAVRTCCWVFLIFFFQLTQLYRRMGRVGRKNKNEIDCNCLLYVLLQNNLHLQ